MDHVFENASFYSSVLKLLSECVFLFYVGWVKKASVEKNKKKQKMNKEKKQNIHSSWE